MEINSQNSHFLSIKINFFLNIKIYQRKYIFCNNMVKLPDWTSGLVRLMLEKSTLLAVA